MAIKVFCDQAQLQGYTNAQGTFHIAVNYTIFYISGGVPGNNSVAFSLDIPPATTPYEVYGLLFQDVLANCARLNLDTPTKADVFGYIPASFDILLPDLPAFN